MDYIEILPISASLKEIVRCYQFIQVGNHETTGRMIEDGYKDLFFLVHGEAYFETSNHVSQKLPSIFSLTKKALPGNFVHSGSIILIAIKFYPWVELPVSNNLTGCYVIDHTQAWENTLQKQMQELKTITNFENSFDRLDQLLSKTDFSFNKGFLLIRSIWMQIHESKGKVDVLAITSSSPASRQRINRVFKEATGFGIKQLARFIRLREAIAFKKRNPSISLTNLSQEFDFFDQSHFIKDCRLLYGTHPLVLFRSKNLIREQMLVT